jgi:hypothetical protein
MLVCFGNVDLILLAVDSAHRRRAVVRKAMKLRIEQKASDTFDEPSVRLLSMKNLGNYQRTRR